MQTISIRLDDETITKIEELRGSEHKSDFYRHLIEHALMTFAHKDLQVDDKTMTSDCKLLQAQNESLNELLKAKDITIKNLENEVGFLISEHGRVTGQLERYLAPSHEEIKVKKWFQFWK